MHLAGNVHIDTSTKGSGPYLEDLTSQARFLVKQVLSNYDDKYGFGSMSCATYDTAWVSLVSKETDGHERWLFEECFDYILQTQSSDGGWTTGSGAHIDSILNTAGALLSISRHAAKPLQLQHDAQDLQARITQATTFLDRQLNTWDVTLTDHVGFEIIVPAILDLLENESPPIRFEFPSRKQLMDINGAKMSRFRPEYLYGSRRMTALHSLESFIGKIDFDRVAHHKVNGSMLGSPSSTAAYLIHASQWDSEAEEYLRHVVRCAAGQGNGGVPSAFPSTHFEATWVLSTLFRAGFSPINLGSEELVKMTNILSSAFEKEDGILGFAPYFEPDVDDTSKTITSLNALGYPASAARMVQVFEADDHFRTYAGERDPSFTANCNALLALLHQPNVAKYTLQIRKITTFLCDYWYKSDERIKDKWNTCYLYPSVLFVEAMVDLLNLTDCGTLASVLDDKLESKVALSLYQASLRPLLDQAENGSWNNSVEETAYGLLILCEARRVAFFDDLQVPLQDGIARALSFLLSTKDDPSYIWIEKVSYASPLLTGAYRLAALNMSRLPPASVVGSKFWKLAKPRIDMEVHVDLFHKAPLFNTLPRWELRASMIEAALLLPSLRARRHLIFPRVGLESDQKYFDVIPFFWTSSNNRDRVYASTQLIDDMTTIAMLNFQLDEFMEATAGPAFIGRMDVLRRMICDLLPLDSPKKCDNNGIRLSPRTTANGLHSPKPRGASDTQYDNVENHISRFLSHILGHPSIARASVWDKKLLRWELRTYLLAHVQQAEDGTRFEQRQLHGKDTSSVSTTTFFQWVRTTSADHISCPYSFHLVSCMLGASLTPGGGGQDCFPSAGEKYLAKDLCTHLATMCRMYNDLGSAVRDLDEGNLNSIEFPEFERHESLNAKMSELLVLGEYERSCMFKAFTELRNYGTVDARTGNDAEARRLAERRFRIWNMFCDEVDLYGQVYVVRDISARLENQSKP